MLYEIPRKEKVMNKIAKHLLSAVTAGAMLCAALPSVALPSFADDAVPTLNDNGTPDNAKDDYYEISNGKQLFWFANLVNGTEEQDPVPNANAKLMNDIGCFNLEDWTSIGATVSYTGTFDGNGYSIDHLHQYVEDAAFCYSLDNGGRILDLTLKECSFFGREEAAGFCCSLGKGIIAQCAIVSSCVRSNGLRAGGIVAYSGRSAAGTGSIQQCLCNADVEVREPQYEVAYAGGIVGELNAGVIFQCLTLGYIDSTTVDNCQYYGGIAAVINSNSGAKVDSSYWLDEAISVRAQKINDTKKDVGNSDEIHCVDKAEMLSGYVCVEVNNGERVFHQNIGREYPTLEPNHHTPTYSNDIDPDTGRLIIVSDPCVYDEHGFCTLCGDAMPATDKDRDGCYEIANVGQLFWFGDYIVQGHLDTDAILTNDIIVNDSRTWKTPNTNDVGYKGKFDGQGHVISGLVHDANSTMGLLFDTIATGAVVKNLGIVDSYCPPLVKCNGLGGICVENRGTILNCYFVGTFKYNGEETPGGICKKNIGNIINSYSYILDAFQTKRTYGICETNGNNDASKPTAGTVENVCYREMEYMSTDGKTQMTDFAKNVRTENVKDCTSGTDDAFASGEICALLNARAGEEIWYQEIGKDLTPVLNPKHGSVNGYTVTVGDNTFSKYVNDGVVGDANDDGEFNMADIVLLQRWLIGEDVELSNWKLLDFNSDGRLNVSDMTLLKTVLLQNEAA